MNNHRISRHPLLSVGTAMIFAVVTFGSYSGLAAAAGIKVTLEGAQEVPSIASTGTGSGEIMVGTDKMVSGSITTTGIDGTMAHIHVGAKGINGPVAITLTKHANTYTVPADAKLTDAQYESFLKEGLYINVHTAANPKGEIRGQLKP